MKPLTSYHPKAAPIVPWSCVAQGEWELDVILALCERLDIGSSDAIDLMAPWPDFVADAWAERLDPTDAATMLDSLASGNLQ